ncbi:hypothetical protein BU23DRAFT_560279 [Bimuria novae-zelandiae CBS 107.79]|uniref:MAGE domain-containing protein n=1 Tax=Bimuria novae-zelandiae CBS 107.79 TaxID=1447943 RepID=A0A6A5UZ46_9PLEO|nr:hypothetical protein BU23DRAFT_560279 [Bimuria novae-zelandiae CBS 107.79]
MWVFRKRLAFDLPIDDTPEAEFLWGTFIKDSEVVVELLEYAADLRKRTGQVYPRLYELCISFWLPHPKNFERALAHHQIMRGELELEKLPLRDLARILKGQLTEPMYDILLDMYKDSSETDLYDEVVPELIGSPAAALRWHAACMLKGDLPSPEVASSPTVQAFLAHNATSADFGVRVKAAIAGSLGRDISQMDHELLRRLRGRDTAPVRFEDSLCARMFATRAIPPESVIRGLALVGVNEIGPLAIRTMASRTEPLSDLPARFQELRKAGIALQGCIFSLALEKFAKEQQFVLVRSMLESDQHPEVYDDLKLQNELLWYYIENQDWDQAHRTLAILSLSYVDSTVQAWNILLQTHIKRCVPEDIFDTLKKMAQHQVPVDTFALILLRRHVLRLRRQGKQPITWLGKHRRAFDDLRFVARVYMFMLQNTMLDIPPRLWHEILRRFGMTGRMLELRRLVHWLFCWYAPRESMPLGKMPKPAFLTPFTERLRLTNPARTEAWRPLSTIGQTHRDHPLSELFSRPFKQALVVWGFRAGLLPAAQTEQSLFAGAAAKKHFRRRFQQRGILHRQNWDIGLKTLVELRQLGLYVNSPSVVRALQDVFVNLFGRGYSKKSANRIMEAVNTTPYPKYVRRVNEIWGSPLLPEPRLYGSSKLHSHMWHPRFERDVRRKGHMKLSEIVARLEEEITEGSEQKGPNVTRVESDARHRRDDTQTSDDSVDAPSEDFLATFSAQGRAINPDVYSAPTATTSPVNNPGLDELTQAADSLPGKKKKGGRN